MDLDDIPEPDCAEAAPHPRHARKVVGQGKAVAAFLDAYNADRLHHAWLLTGADGVGKATLAWQIARFVLANPPTEDGLFAAAAPPAATDLETDHETPVGRRVSALSEPGLHLLRRPWDAKKKALSTQTTVDAVRALKRQFSMSLPDGGRRVVIVDSANDLNNAAANALLKLLEEPPANTIFLLVSAQPSALLPTIRSRCRTLTCAPLSDGDVAELLGTLAPELEAAAANELASLAGGSLGVAMRLHAHDGVALQRDLISLFETMPDLDRMRALALSTRLSARDADPKRTLFLDLTDAMIAALARQGVGVTEGGSPNPAQGDLLRRLAPNSAAGRKWADAQAELTGRVRRGLSLNLDPHSLILDMVLRIDGLARASVDS